MSEAISGNERDANPGYRFAHPGYKCYLPHWRPITLHNIITIIERTEFAMHDRAPAPKVEYGVTPTHVIASMSGLDFVRAIFEGKLPAPPIMQNVEPFDSTAETGHVVFHSVPGFRHYNPIGSVHGGYAAILLDSAMGLAVHTALPAGTGYTTLEFKISFIKGMTKDTGPVRTEGKTLSVGRRAATAEARITDTKGRLLAHATTTCLVFDIPKEPSKGT
jgi:uncharacterized protein (TIGR00369 family)